jgi:DNA-binding CsgD family transcriptional regulator
MITDPIPEITGTHSFFEDKISELAAIADTLPVVIIVHQLEPYVVNYLSPNGLKILGFCLEEITAMGIAYLDAFFNPEDIAHIKSKVYELLASANDEKIVSYFHQVRPSPDQEWKWYLGTTKVFMRDETGRPTHIINTVSPVDPLHHVTNKVSRLLEENNFLRRNQKIFASLGRREKEILKCMALGGSAAEIAAQLFISEQTVNTHRRNIKAKLNAESNYDIVKFAQAFDLI